MAAQPDAAVPATADVRVRRWFSSLSPGDWLFAVVLLVEACYVLVALGAGVLATAAGSSAALHEDLHIRGVLPTAVGRVAEGIADASHGRWSWPQLALDYGFSVFNLALAGFLLWLRPRDRSARLLALGLMGTAVAFNLNAYTVYEAMDATGWLATAHWLFQLIAVGAYLLALLLFPDGKLVPRWSRPAQLALHAAVGSGLLALVLLIRGTSRTLAIVLVFGLLAPAVGVAAQAYRYRRAPTPVERQQSRLLFWALTPALLLGLYTLTQDVMSSAFFTYAGRDLDLIPVALFRVFQATFAVVPIALFVGILRFRLWNIDRVISRALVYSSLAVFVSLVYVGVVVGVGRAIGLQGDNVVLSIVATGVVAVAFQPAKERARRVVNRLVYGRRVTPYQVLSEFSEHMAESVATEEKLSRTARLLAEGTAATRADVWLVVAGGVRRAASWPESDDAALQLSLVDGQLPQLPWATACVAVRHQEELLGALTITKPANEVVDLTEERLLADLASQTGLLLRNVRLTTELLLRLDELRASRQRLVSAQDQARRQLERNLHDGAQQQLVALKVKLGLARRLAEAGKPVEQLLGQLGDETDDAIDTLRDLARGIYPPLLADQGLAAALRAQANKAPLPVAVEADALGRYPQEVEAAVYFCCLEGLQNVSKYADASSVTIRLGEDGGWLRFSVSDEGGGFYLLFI
ncbi:MAG: histidine kinase [Actinomycetota bacterium]|nr:histidine kinase [Actinomycetota bacterium]